MESETGQERMSIKLVRATGTPSCQGLSEKQWRGLPEGGWAFTPWFPTPMLEGSCGHQLPRISKLSCAWADQALVTSENAVRQKSGETGVWELSTTAAAGVPGKAPTAASVSCLRHRVSWSS